jgi:hypothetical protein
MRRRAYGLQSQFICPLCGKGFEQKSKIQRHTESAHPPSVPSAADIERALKGIKYPKSKEELTEIATRRKSTISSDVLSLIISLPNRTYRDSAEIAIALGELKSGKMPRSVAQMARLEAPSKKGGRNALKSSRISSATIARALKGIDFPKSKSGIIMHVGKDNNSSRKERIVSVLRRISDKKYQNLVEVTKEIGKVK